MVRNNLISCTTLHLNLEPLDGTGDAIYVHCCLAYSILPSFKGNGKGTSKCNGEGWNRLHSNRRHEEENICATTILWYIRYIILQLQSSDQLSVCCRDLLTE